MTIRTELTSGGSRFVLDHKVAGKRQRRYFKTLEDAQAGKKEAESSQAALGESLGLMRASQRAELILAQERASELNFSVLEAVDHYAKYIIRKPITESFGDAIELFLSERKKQTSSDSYRNLKSIIRRWGADVSVDRVIEIDKRMIVEWIETLTSRCGLKPARARTRNGYLLEIKSFLNWAKENYIVEINVADKIPQYKPTVEELNEIEGEAHILSPSEVKRVFDWIVKNRPDMTPRAAVLFFAGLRPDREANLFRWEHVDFNENLLFVPSGNAKDRQRRYIEMNPTLVAWLKWAKNENVPTPTPVINWDNGWSKAKKEVEFWPHDAARHCYASYSLPVDGIKKTTSNLGHGDFDMLFKHYRTVVKRSASDEFFSIMPPVNVNK